jgi:hypothetical protein
MIYLDLGFLPWALGQLSCKAPTYAIIQNTQSTVVHRLALSGSLVNGPWISGSFRPVCSYDFSQNKAK